MYLQNNILLLVFIDDPPDKSARCCPKTCWPFRQKLQSTGNAERTVNDATKKLICEFNADASCVRIDSTHLNSSVKRGRGAEIFRAALKNFLRRLNKGSEAGLFPLDSELVKRRLKTQSGGGSFRQVKPSEARRKLERMARDIF